jgi:hypothetical protein
MMKPNGFGRSRQSRELGEHVRANDRMACDDLPVLRRERAFLLHDRIRKREHSHVAKTRRKLELRRGTAAESHPLPRGSDEAANGGRVSMRLCGTRLQRQLECEADSLLGSGQCRAATWPSLGSRRSIGCSVDCGRRAQQFRNLVDGVHFTFAQPWRLYYHPTPTSAHLSRIWAKSRFPKAQAPSEPSC